MRRLLKPLFLFIFVIITVSLLFHQDTGLNGFISDLKSAGYRLEKTHETHSHADIFKITHDVYIFRIDSSEKISVHVFGNPELARQAEENVIGVSPVTDWVGRPKLFRKEKIIVFYTGSNKDLQRALTLILGEPRTVFY